MIELDNRIVLFLKLLILICVAWSMITVGMYIGCYLAAVHFSLDFNAILEFVFNIFMFLTYIVIIICFFYVAFLFVVAALKLE